VELPTRTVMLVQLAAALWCLGLLGSFALGIAFLAGDDQAASLACLWTFALFLGIGTGVLGGARVAAVLAPRGTGEHTTPDGQGRPSLISLHPAADRSTGA
jgi:hypothetical protein